MSASNISSLIKLPVSSHLFLQLSNFILLHKVAGACSFLGTLSLQWRFFEEISYTVQKFDIYMRFPWSTTHNVPLNFLYCSEIWDFLGQWQLLHFLYCSEIWHLHDISMVSNTWHVVTFPTEVSMVRTHGIPLHFLHCYEIWH